MNRTPLFVLGSMLFAGCLGGYPEAPGEPDSRSDDLPAPAPVPAPEPVPDDGYDGYDSGYYGDLGVSNAFMSGDMGSVHDFAGEATSVYGYQGGGYADLNVVVTGERGSAMAIFGIEGGLDHPAFAPGNRFRFDNSGGGGGAVYMYVTGCSGQREGSWEFDAPADEVIVEVAEGTAEDRLLFDFEAHFGGGDGTTEGSFEVHVP